MHFKFTYVEEYAYINWLYFKFYCGMRNGYHNIYFIKEQRFYTQQINNTRTKGTPLTPERIN